MKALNSHDKISPHWCVLCKDSNEFQGHIFATCFFSSGLWIEVLSIFGWIAPLPSKANHLLAYMLDSHPSKKEKKILWMHFTRAIFWAIWMERNHRIFQDKELPFDRLFESIVFLVISWCKCSPCHHYSFSSLIYN